MKERIRSNHGKRNNDPQVEQFLDLLTANQHKIYAHILSRVPRLADADDIMQETTTLMWRKYGQFTPGTNFVAWGKAIAHFQILKYLKTKSPYDQLSPAAAEAIGHVADKMIHECYDRIAVLKECVEKLDERDRRMLQMRYDWDVPVKDIAERFGQSIQKIYRTFTRMHDALLRCVRRTMAEETAT